MFRYQMKLIIATITKFLFMNQFELLFDEKKNNFLEIF
jgi:hypothetical protein